MSDEILQAIDTAVRDAVKETVNGKIDELAKHLNEQDKKLDTHIETMQPVIEGLTFLKTASVILKYLAGFILSFAAVWAIIKGWIKL